MDSDRHDGGCDLCPSDKKPVWLLQIWFGCFGDLAKDNVALCPNEVYIIAVVRLDFGKNDVAGLYGWCSRLDGPMEADIAGIDEGVKRLAGTSVLDGKFYGGRAN